MRSSSHATRVSLIIASFFWMTVAHAGWRPTLSEEFTGNTLNSSIWNVVLDTYGDQSLPGNNELECYIPSALGLANGVLTIAAQRQTTQCTQPQGSYPYSSGAISSFTKPSPPTGFAQQYGYFEMRAQIPGGGLGLWPAFWLLPNPSGWPPEIDVMEAFGTSLQIGTTYHWQDPTFGHIAVGRMINTTDLSTDYHRYGVDWQPGMLVYYLDGNEVFRVTSASVPQAPMFVLANLAVGGFGGDPSNTPFPQTMLVDYIHVYARDPSVPGDDSLPPQASSPANVPGVPLDIRAIDFGTRNVTVNGHAQGQYAAAYSGNAWSLIGPGFIEQLLDFGTATNYQFTVEAQSDSGAAVTMSVDIDGQSVATTAVSSTTLQTYTLKGPVPAGLHNVAIRMQNPASGQTLTLGTINIRDPSVPLPSPSNTPISVGIYSPQNNSDLTPGAWTTISGAASGGTGIEKVQYLIDGNLFCTALTSPYNCPYAPPGSGSHTLTARAIDTSGTSQTASVTYQVGSGGSSSPNISVSIWAPQNGQTFAPNFWTTLTAVASGNNPISKLDFYVDGTLICGNVAAASPTNCSYQTPASGTHTVEVVATDSTGATGQQTASFSIQQSANISVTIWAPQAGQTFAPNFWTTLTAVASGNNPISKFDFYVDGSLVCGNVAAASPTNCSYQTPASGTHTVQVVATDNTGATGQSSVSFSVQ